MGLRSLIPFIEPLGLVWFWLAATAGWLCWRRRWRLAIPAGLLWLLYTATVCTPLPRVLMGSLENPWSKVDLRSLPAADAVLALGGTLIPSPGELAGFRAGSGTDRLITATELARLGKAEALVFSGGGPQPGRLAEAEVSKAWIDSWQVLKTPVLTLGPCADTRDEAVKMAALAKERGWSKIILVTSAAHMRRAEAVFRKAGLEVACAPCTWLATNRETKVRWLHSPKGGGAEILNSWLHEQLGWWWYRWRGWI